MECILAVVATCDNPIGVVLKKELYKILFLKQLVDCTFSFSMERENVRQSLTVIQNVIREVRKGRNYLIFPEGTAQGFIFQNHTIAGRGGIGNKFDIELKDGAGCPGDYQYRSGEA